MKTLKNWQKKFTEHLAGFCQAQHFKINGQRLKFDNYFVSVCETTIEQILFIAI